jgi:WD40 repeat protein
MAFSPSGNYLVTGGTDRTVKVWDGYGLQQKGNLTGPEKAVMYVEFSRSEDFVVAGCSDGSTWIWANFLRVHKCLRGHQGKVFSAKLLGSEDKLITCSDDKTIKIWDIQQRTCIKSISCKSSPNDIGISKDGCMLYSAHTDCCVRVWDSKNGECIYEIGNIHTDRITSLSVSPDGCQILTNSRDNSLKVISTFTYEVEATMRHDGYRNGLPWARACWSPDGRLVAAGAQSGAIFVWEAASAALQSSLSGTQRSCISQIAWNPSGIHVVSSDRTGYISFWS